MAESGFAYNNVDELLAQRDWVVRLARGLLRDEARVEDVVQDTFLAALESPPHSPQYEASRQNWMDTISGVFRQDTDVVKAVQERAHVRDELGISTRFSPYWESCVHRFQQVVFERITAGQ